MVVIVVGFTDGGAGDVGGTQAGGWLPACA
jgi:hypothetical protein